MRSRRIDFHNFRILLAAALSLILFVAGCALTVYAAENSTADTSPAVSDDISEADGPSWDRVESDSEDPSGQVLEIPSVATGETAANEDSADTTDSGDQTAAADPNDSSSDDQVGDVAQYQDDGNQGVASAMPLWPRPPVVMGFPRSRLGTPGYALPYPGAIVAKPNGLMAIPATSPMLTTPRGSYPIMGGWWTRARR